MAKAIKQQSTAPSINSVKDLGYQFSLHTDKDNDFSVIAKELIPTIATGEISDEHKTELMLGFELRYNENNPPVVYLKEGADNYVPVKAPVEGKNCVTIGVHQATAYTTHAFGALRKDTPNLHSIVGELRDKFSKYASQKLMRLIDSCKPKGERKRTVNLDFAAFVAKTKDTIFTRAKNAKAKGDTTAPSAEKLSRAWAAFNNELAK